MITLLLFVVVFLLLVLTIIWTPYIRTILQKSAGFSNDERLRDQTNIQLYHEHKAEIEQDFEQQKIDEESYQYLLNELDNSLLQEIEAEEKAQQNNQHTSGKMSFLWPVVLTVFVIVFSFYGYEELGAYNQLSSTQFMSHRAVNEQVETPQVTEQEALKNKLAALEERTKAEPKNADVWYEYGQNLVLSGQFSAAASAFDRVIAIDGESADLFGAKAQALYYAANQKITEPVQQLIDKALALDAFDPSTNILLGMDSFLQKNYQQAVDYWQKVVDSGRANVNVEALNRAIAEATNRLSLTGKINNNDATNKPELQLNVSLSKDIEDEIKNGPDLVVFIFATPANGQRMPVAAVKMKTSDLPTTIVLNDARAMSPQHNLSSVDAVNIQAVVSHSGSVGFKSGDFKGELLNISSHTKEPLTLTINQKVP